MDVLEAPPAGTPAADFDPEWLRAHLSEERRTASLLGEIREAIFGAQDGLVSTLAVVSTVAGASANRFPVLIAGIASGLAGVFSMAADQNANVIFGAVIDDQLKDEVRVTVIATGFGTQRRRRARPGIVEGAPVGDRRPEFDPGDSLDVPSFLRDE
jgi:hypothetical protein